MSAALPVLALVVALASPAAAHPLAPALLDVQEHPDGRADVTWKVPLLRVRGMDPAPVLPARCTAEGPPTVTRDDTGVRSRWRIACGPGGLVGTRIGVRGLVRGGPGTVVRVVLADGRRAQGVLSAGRPALVVPPEPRARDVLADYLRLGTGHILSGPDHLLFVFGLVLLGGTTRRVLAMLTAFTAGHSLTLALAVLGFVDLPPRPIEVGIAASVFALAVEVTRAPTAATVLRRWPWAMAVVFGLLHGLGFAAGLREAGLPADDVPMALLGFNLGVEAGQIAFVVLVLGTRRLVAALPLRPSPALQRVPAYAMGSLAAFWLLERTVALWR